MRSRLACAVRYFRLDLLRRRRSSRLNVEADDTHVAEDNSSGEEDARHASLMRA
jgi:hypothetical protein